MSVVAVKPELINWAIERSGRPIEDFADKFPHIFAWLKGEKQPTLSKLEDFAKKTYTPLGYFFLDNPPEEKLPIPDYRTFDDKIISRPSPDMLEIIQIMQRRQNWMREYLMEEKENPLPFVGSAKVNDDIVDLANNIRQTLGFQKKWASQYQSWEKAFVALRDAIENIGILVMINSIIENNTHRKLKKEEFRGFVLKDEYAPLIFINGDDYKAAQMFTLAHELVHIWLGSSGIVNFTTMEPGNFDIEKYCNKIAAEFLVPSSELNELLTENYEANESIKKVAIKFRVSQLVIARRLLDLGYISRKIFLDFFTSYKESFEIKKQNKKDTQGGDFFKSQNYRLGKRFPYTVVIAAQEGRLLYRDAYHLTALRGKTFDKYVQQMEF